jgi:limonene-1,2-epoxide hydrolase
MADDAGANDALIRAFLAAWERRDGAFIVDCLTDDAVYHAVPLEPIVGKVALERWVAGFAGVPPGKLVVHHQAASGGVVMNERTDHLTIAGAPVTLPICAVFELRHGKVRAWREYFDLGAVQRAVAGEDAPAPGEA